MKKAIFILMLFSHNLYSQEDYRIYHMLINNAERCFFLEGKLDSTYFYYDMAFGKFDFVFVKDCYMAAQIAYYQKNEKYIAYIKKGFKNGLRPEQLKYSDLFIPLLNDSVTFKKKFSDYVQLHKIYLKRINVWALKKIIQNISQDQSEKHLYHNDNVVGYEYIYYQKLILHINFIETLIKQVGFPGDKLIGIDQVDIMKELGQDNSDYMDLYNLIYKDPKYQTEKNQFQICDDCLAQSSVFPLLIHHVCIYQFFSSYWSKLIISGQIHPREVALLFDLSLQLYDFPAVDPVRCRKIADAFGCDYVLPYGGYKISSYLHWGNFKYPRHIIDSMRTTLFINTLAVDSAKHSYGDKHGFKTYFGYSDCR